MQALGVTAFSLLTWAVCAVLVLGLVWRLARWARTPIPWRLPLYASGQARAPWPMRLTWQALAWPALWRSSPRRWLLAWPLHACLLLLFLDHLRRWGFLPGGWPPAAWAPWAGWLLACLLLLLLIRRLATPLSRLLSTWQDYLAPALLLALCLSGLFMAGQVSGGPSGLAGLGGRAPVGPPAFWLHHGLGLVFLAYLPWGKLAHGLGLLASPGLTQAALPEGGRHSNPWDAQAAGPELADQDLAPGQPLWWTQDKYQAALKQRWAGAGVHRVLAARDRQASLAEDRLDGQGGPA